MSGTALAVVLVALPLAHHWATREAVYAATRERWVRFATLAASTERLRRALTEQQAAVAAEEAQLVTGATPALAASALQGLLQRYADESAVQLDRVDVAGQPRLEPHGLLAIPVQLQGQGDIYGLVDFLYRVQRGDKLLVVEELAVNAGFTAAFSRSEGAGGRQYLSWSLRLHGLYPGAMGAKGS